MVQGDVIQTFEVTYDLCWKAIFRSLREQQNTKMEPQMSRKEILCLAGKCHLIDHAEEWLQFHSQRNNTSHNYDENLVNETVILAGSLLQEAKILLRNLKHEKDA